MAPLASSPKTTPAPSPNIMTPPSAFSPAFFGLTLAPSKFRAHRAFGLLFLLLYPLSWVLFLAKPNVYTASPLPVLVPALGLLQSLTAAHYFRFLPRNSDNGLFSDKGILSYNFLLENIFYQLLAVFGAVFYCHRDALEASHVGRAMIQLFVFFPYTFLRPFFPTTSFSKTNSSEKTGKYRTVENARFYQNSTQLIR